MYMRLFCLERERVKDQKEKKGPDVLHALITNLLFFFLKKNNNKIKFI